MKKGTQVKIKGLIKASIHNGKIGVVIKEQASSSWSDRVGVKLLDNSNSGKTLAVKIENLEPITTTPAKKQKKNAKHRSEDDIHQLVTNRFKELRSHGVCTKDAMHQAREELQPSEENEDAGRKVAAMFGM